MKEKLNEIKIAALEKLNQVSDLQALESLRVEILGKKGELTQILKGMGSLSKEERPVIGQLANEVRSEIGRAIISCSSYFGIVLNDDVLRISSAIITLGSAADTGSGPSAVCRNIGMALNGDIAAFCAIAATDAGSIVPQCVCFYR